MLSMAESQSDQSDNERPAEDPQNDDSSDDNQSSDESSDDSDGGGLLDTMAADGSEEESSDEDDEENEYESHLRGDPDDDYFPQFCRLPIELRHRIWELFCPELRARYRVLDFIISYGTARHPEAASAFVWTVRDGIALEDQTQNLRTVLAVHQESRALATNAFPDTLSIDAGSGDSTVPFNRNSDVVLVNGLCCPDGRNIFHLPDFASEVKNLALGGPDILDHLSSRDVPTLLDQFTQLESFYVSVSSTECQKSSLKWCTSDLVNHYQTQTYEKSPGLGEDLQFMWCWPDLQRHPHFAKFQINRDTWDSLPEPLGSALERRGIKAWPMVAFEYERGLRRYEMLQTLGPDFGDDSDSSEEEEDDDEDNGPDLDQYESDGIDDDEIAETYEDSDEEGISLDDGASSPPRHQVHRISDDEDDEDGAGANFSDPETDPEPESAPVQRGRKRRVVSDSDDEEDEEVQPSTKRARVLVDSDDEDDEPQVSQPERGHKRSKTVVSDDEDDDEEQGGVSRQESDNAGNSPSSSEEESEESDDEDAPPAKLSLAERLRLHRKENPIENGDSDEDASSRTADEDSEDDDEDDEEEERNPFMMGMADESDGEGEDYDEDDY